MEIIILGLLAGLVLGAFITGIAMLPYLSPIILGFYLADTTELSGEIWELHN